MINNKTSDPIHIEYLIAHEVGHTLVALSLGLEIKYVTLAFNIDNSTPHVKLAVDICKCNLDLGEIAAFYLAGEFAVDYYYKIKLENREYVKAYNDLKNIHALNDHENLSEVLKNISSRETFLVHHQAYELNKHIFDDNKELFDLLFEKLKIHMTLYNEELKTLGVEKNWNLKRHNLFSLKYSNPSVIKNITGKIKLYYYQFKMLFNQ